MQLVRSRMNVHEIIDEFATRIDPSAKIRRVESAPWVEDLEAKLPKRFPASFRSLLMRYSFRSFDVGGLSFFANTGTESDEELSIAIFKDPVLAPTLLKAGYIQFARTDCGSYDPICFDARQSASNREFPIVRVDHESILRFEGINVSEHVADSFFKFASYCVTRT